MTNIDLRAVAHYAGRRISLGSAITDHAEELR